MILLTILVLITVLLVIATVAALSIFGSGALIIFGDVIVCIVIIGVIIKAIIQRRNDKW